MVHADCRHLPQPDICLAGRLDQWPCSKFATGVNDNLDALELSGRVLPGVVQDHLVAWIDILQEHLMGQVRPLVIT